MVPFSLQIHVFIGGDADPGVAIAIIAPISSNFLINDCVEVFVSLGQGHMRLGLATAEIHLLAVVVSVLLFLVHTSFALVDDDPTLFHGVIAIPVVLAIVTSLAIGMMLWRILSPVM
eukprot:5741435-Ditylum_brightwellii.AAC.1